MLKPHTVTEYSLIDHCLFNGFLCPVKIRHVREGTKTKCYPVIRENGDYVFALPGGGETYKQTIEAFNSEFEKFIISARN
mgnify:CR=1 FL=1